MIPEEEIQIEEPVDVPDEKIEPIVEPEMEEVKKPEPIEGEETSPEQKDPDLEQPVLIPDAIIRPQDPEPETIPDDNSQDPETNIEPTAEPEKLP